MNKKDLIAPCGLECFNCNLHKDNLTDEYKKKVAEYQRIAPGEVECKGCRAENGKCRYAEFDCATYKCVQKKGVTYCFECKEFPCGLLTPSSLGANYPHNMKVYNLCRMKLNGIDAWIEESAYIRKRYYNGKFVVGKGPVLED